MAISCCFGRDYSQRSKPSLKMAYLILRSLQVYCTSNFEERVETPTPPNWNSSSAKAIFDLKSHLTAFKLHHRKEEGLANVLIYSNGLELALEQKRVTKFVSRLYRKEIAILLSDCIRFLAITTCNSL